MRKFLSVTEPKSSYGKISGAVSEIPVGKTDISGTKPEPFDHVTTSIFFFLANWARLT